MLYLWWRIPSWRKTKRKLTSGFQRSAPSTSCSRSVLPRIWGAFGLLQWGSIRLLHVVFCLKSLYDTFMTTFKTTFKRARPSVHCAFSKIAKIGEIRYGKRVYLYQRTITDFRVKPLLTQLPPPPLTLLPQPSPLGWGSEAYRRRSVFSAQALDKVDI